MTQITPRKRLNRRSNQHDKENQSPKKENRTSKRAHNSKEITQDESPPKRLCDNILKINDNNTESRKSLHFSPGKNSNSRSSSQNDSLSSDEDIIFNIKKETSSGRSETEILSPFKSLSLCIEKCDSIKKSPQTTKIAKKIVESIDSKIKSFSIKSPVKTEEKGLTDYQLVCQALSCSSSKLVCRDPQLSEMRVFLESKLSAGSGSGSMYISGAPGTGKTASLTQTLNSIPSLSKISPHWVNCMGVQSSSAVFYRIAKELSLPATTSECKARRAIEKYITSAKKTILLVLDEVDQLETKDQDVLYTIFEWPALKGSRLLLFAIANRLDLTERVLPRLNSSTCAPCRLHFPPYNKTEIATIITNRLEQTGCTWSAIIKPIAIQLLSGKVAAVAGDVRRALEVCRRAVENCHTKARIGGFELKPLAVDAGTVLKLFNEIYGSRVMTALTEAPSTLPMQQKMLLCTLLLIQKYGKNRDVTVGKLQEIFNKVCENRKIPRVDGAEFQSLSSLLQTRCMINITKHKDARMAKVTLLLDSTEVEKILTDTQLLYQVLEDRDALGKCAKPVKKT